MEVVALKTDETSVRRPIALVTLARSALASPVLRFLIVGGGNTLLYAVLSLLFMWLLPFSKQVSSTLAYLAGIPVAFLAYKTFVFRAESATSHSEILRFLVTHSVNLVVSYAMVAVLCSGLVFGHAFIYLTVEQAQAAIFPGQKLTSADLNLTPEQRKAIARASDVRVRNPELKVWKVEGGGWFILDEVIGKHEFITYAVGLNADGSVKHIEVMDYRETYGYQIRDEKWRAQFAGKKHGAKLKLDDDIKNISGATLSCRHLTDGVKRLLATHALVLQNLR